MSRMVGTVTRVLLNRGFAFVRGVDDGLWKGPVTTYQPR
jgi:hypothetical protein